MEDKILQFKSREDKKRHSKYADIMCRATVMGLMSPAGVITGAAGLFGISYLISPKVEELEDLFEEMSDGEP